MTWLTVYFSSAHRRCRNSICHINQSNGGWKKSCTAYYTQNAITTVIGILQGGAAFSPPVWPGNLLRSDSCFPISLVRTCQGGAGGELRLLLAREETIQTGILVGLMQGLLGEPILPVAMTSEPFAPASFNPYPLALIP